MVGMTDIHCIGLMTRSLQHVELMKGLQHIVTNDCQVQSFDTFLFLSESLHARVLSFESQLF